MNSVSEDIKDILDGQSSLGLTFPTDLFIGRVPPEPDDCVVILDTMGLAPQLTYDKAEVYEYPSFQIRVRNTSYLDGWALVDSIKTVLHGRANETWNGTIYTLIQCAGGPAFLEWDQNNRAIFICNFNTQRR